MRARLVEFEENMDPYKAIAVGQVSLWAQKLGDLKTVITSGHPELEFVKNYWNIFQCFLPEDNNTIKRDYRGYIYYEYTNIHIGLYKTEIKEFLDFVRYLNLDYSKLSGRILDLFEKMIFIKNEKEVNIFIEEFIKENKDYIGFLNNLFLKRLARIIGKDKLIEYAKHFDEENLLFKIGLALNDKSLQNTANIKSHMPVSSRLKTEDTWISIHKSGSTLYALLKWMKAQTKSVRYVDMIATIIKKKFNRNYTKDDRGYWSHGIRYYVVSGYIIKSDDGYYITQKGIERLKNLETKFDF